MKQQPMPNELMTDGNQDLKPRKRIRFRGEDDAKKHEDVMTGIRQRISEMPLEEPERGVAEAFYHRYPDEWVTEENGYEHLVCHPEAWFRAKLKTVMTPISMKECSFDNFEMTTSEHKRILTDVVTWCEKLSNQPQYRNLLLAGPTGSGKTHLAVSAAKLLVRNGFGPRYYYWRELVEEFRADIPNDLYGDEPIIIDDLGESSAQSYVLDRLQLILKHRLENFKPTIITSNLLWPDDFIQHKLADDRLVSRFAEFSQITMVDLDDWRIKQRCLNK